MNTGRCWKSDAFRERWKLPTLFPCALHISPTWLFLSYIHCKKQVNGALECLLWASFTRILGTLSSKDQKASSLISDSWGCCRPDTACLTKTRGNPSSSMNCQFSVSMLSRLTSIRWDPCLLPNQQDKTRGTFSIERNLKGNVSLQRLKVMLFLSDCGRRYTHIWKITV